MTNRLRWHLHLHELDPELEPPAQRLGQHFPTRRSGSMSDQYRTSGGADRQTAMAVRLAHRLVTAIRALTVRADALDREISPLIAQGRATACRVARLRRPDRREDRREYGQPSRFRSEACLAMHADTEPIPVWSGRTQRHGLARDGNRQLNAALRRIALTQIAGSAASDTPTTSADDREATPAWRPCALKRRLACIVFNLLTPTPNQQHRRSAGRGLT